MSSKARQRAVRKAKAKARKQGGLSKWQEHMPVHNTPIRRRSRDVLPLALMALFGGGRR